MRITIELTGTDRLIEELRQRARRADHPERAFDAVADDWADVARRQFESQGRHGSGGWPRLAASTIARKSVQGLDPRILHATGRLRRSLTEEHHHDHVRRVTADGVTVTTRVPYARYHRRRRPPFALTRRDRRGAVERLQRFLATGKA